MPDNILFSSDPSSALKKFLDEKAYSKILVLTDENTLKYCYPKIKGALPEHGMIQVKSGEENKMLQTCMTIWKSMTEQSLDRHSALIVLGGGVLGDMGGFCAATYKRGIDFILIPTTLLSQVDASIGGKLGIDFDHYKNHIGVFQTPAFTLLHSDFIKTLSDSELRSGFAEVIKHTLISDEKMWNEIRTRSIRDQNFDTLIAHSVNFKLKVVTEDPKEKGLRKILNAGHTIGHAIETYLLNTDKKVTHGEAIAAGLIAESFIAKEKGLLSEGSLSQIAEYIIKTFGKISLDKGEFDAIALLTVQDKKNKGNKILSVLLEKIGTAKWDCEISLDEVKRALSFYLSI
jgi:3-dehydroquinate synthase